MQQLQSNYRGDSSPSLAQIFGMQYQPQGATSQMANTALSSGMSAGAQIKATSMNNDTQMAISNAARMENRRQFNLTNALAGRTANETQRHNMALEGISKQTTDWQTGGSIAADDQKALGAIQGQITEMEMVLNNLDKNDPQYPAYAAMIQERIKAIKEGANKASASRGGASGFAAQTGRMYDPKGGSFTSASGRLLEAAGLMFPQSTTQSPAMPGSRTPAVTPAITPSATPTLGGSVFNVTTPPARDPLLTGVTPLAGQYTLPTTFPPAPASPVTTAAATPPPVTPPAATTPAATSTPPAPPAAPTRRYVVRPASSASPVLSPGRTLPVPASTAAPARRYLVRTGTTSP